MTAEEAYASPLFGGQSNEVRKSEILIENGPTHELQQQTNPNENRIKRSRSENRKGLTTRMNEDKPAMRKTNNFSKIEHALKSLGETMRGIGGGKHIFSKAEEYILQKLK